MINFTYPGGKNGSGTFQKIINKMPPHRVYIEPFLGSGAILRNKQPATQSIGLDIDPDVIAWWKSNPMIIPSNTTILQANALFYLEKNKGKFTSDTLIYIDPPYLLETRSCQRKLYNHEFSETREHKKLLEIIASLNCMIMISGYLSPLYTSLLATWWKYSFQVITRSGKMANEILWMNFPEPLVLHDYRYIGENYRERERIKRKIQRWKSRLARMDRIERQAILLAMDELRSLNNNNNDATRL